MQGHHAVLIKDQQEARSFLEEIGVDPGGRGYMIPKAVFRSIKLKNVPCRAAILIKQEMLSQGGEAAVSRETINGQGFTDVLLMGTVKQYAHLLKKLPLQPFGLKKLAEEIRLIIEALEPHNWNIKIAGGGSLVLGEKTTIMGILNITPDSFSDGGMFMDTEKAVQHALEMRAAGADIIDVGGASSRPSSVMASADEEIRRILPVIERLAQEDMLISVDTFRAEVARAALEAGAHLINDIGRLQLDPDLINVLRETQAPVVLMHNRMQLRPGEPYQDLIADIILELKESISQALAAGLNEEQIIIDPGLGFGKNTDENNLIVKRLAEFKSLGKPILLGASRKTFIGQTLEQEVPDRLAGSLAVLVMAIMNGANIIRVHDVRESKLAAQMVDAVRRVDG